MLRVQELLDEFLEAARLRFGNAVLIHLVGPDRLQAHSAVLEAAGGPSRCLPKALHQPLHIYVQACLLLTAKEICWQSAACWGLSLLGAWASHNLTSIALMPAGA